MPKKKSEFKKRLEYSLFSLLLAVLGRTSRIFRHPQESLLIFFLKLLDRRHCRILAENLRHSFPEKNPEELRVLQNATYRHFIHVLVEIIQVFHCPSAEKIVSRSLPIGVENLQNALEKKKGAILVTAHFGNWEWIPAILCPKIHKTIHGLARPLDNERIEEKLRRFREGWGGRVIYKQKSIRKILELLKKNEIICMLVDHNTIPREGVPITFFSRKAYAVPTPAQLHLKLGVPVLPLFVHYENEKIVLEIFPELKAGRTDDMERDICRLTQEINTKIEGQIRHFPEQWFWFHERWKNKPAGDADATR